MTNTSPGFPNMQRHLGIGSIIDLPAWSTLGGRSRDEQLDAAFSIGVRGIQALSDEGLDRNRFTLVGMGGIRTPADADTFARRSKDLGFDFSTATVGTGFESDGEMDALAAAVLEASERNALPIYVETHRATMTQDIFRTLALIERFPELRFNADLSHWYTGHELGADEGAFEAKVTRLEPLFQRVRYVHGRIGTTCCMQVSIDGPDDPRSFVRHFRLLWRRTFEGFLKTAAPGETIAFAPELLPATVTFKGRVIELNYARLVPDAAGTLKEESDRWQQCLYLFEIAEAAFTDAIKSVAQEASR